MAGLLGVMRFAPQFTGVFIIRVIRIRIYDLIYIAYRFIAHDPCSLQIPCSANLPAQRLASNYQAFGLDVLPTKL